MAAVYFLLEVRHESKSGNLPMSHLHGEVATLVSRNPRHTLGYPDHHRFTRVTHYTPALPGGLSIGLHSLILLSMQATVSNLSQNSTGYLIFIISFVFLSLSPFLSLSLSTRTRTYPPPPAHIHPEEQSEASSCWYSEIHAKTIIRQNKSSLPVFYLSPLSLSLSLSLSSFFPLHSSCHSPPPHPQSLSLSLE